jgi:hypothetical protein
MVAAVCPGNRDIVAAKLSGWPVPVKCYVKNEKRHLKDKALITFANSGYPLPIIDVKSTMLSFVKTCKNVNIKKTLRRVTSE